MRLAKSCVNLLVVYSRNFMNPEMPKFNQSPSDPNKEAVKTPKTEGKLELETPQETMERLAKEAVKKPEEKTVETKKPEGGAKTAKEKAIEGTLYFAEKYGLKPPEKLEEKPKEKTEAEKPKEKEVTFEQKETELREKLVEARNILAELKENDPRYNLALENYKEVRDNFRDTIFKNKEIALKGASKEEKEKALNETAQNIFEKLYIQEAQNLRSRQVEVKAEQKKEKWVLNSLYKAVDSYRKMPFKYKIGISVALMAGTATFGTGTAAVATLFASATVAQRILGGAATAIGLEAAMKRAQEKHRKGETLSQKLYKKLGGKVEDVSQEGILNKMKEEFEKDIEAKAEKEIKAANILEAMEQKGKELDVRLDKLSKGEKWEERKRYILAGTMGVLVGSGMVAKAFRGVYEMWKEGGLHAVPLPEKPGGVRLGIGERGPEGAVIDYLKSTGVPEATAGKQAHLMFLDFMKSPDVSKFMAEKGMVGNKEAYLELMKLIKKGAVEIAPDGKLKLVDMEYVSDAFRKAMGAAGEKALEADNASKVAANLAAQETYRGAEDAFYAGKTTDYYKSLENYYTQTGKPHAAEMYRMEGKEFLVNPPPGDIEADWKFIHGLSNLSKEEYTVVKDLKVGEVLKKTYWGMTDETRFPVAGERDHLELWRKMGLRNKIMEMASKLPDDELQKAQDMDVHDFLKEHYIEPQVEAVKAESVAEVIKPPVGAEAHLGGTEAPLAGAEAGAVEKAAGAVHNKIIENTDAGVKGIFKYAPDGKIEKLIVSGGENASKASKLLQDNWREVLRGGKLTANLDRSVVENRAVTILQNQDILKTMEEVGRGNSVEADYIRQSIQKTIELTEKKYGDVFK